MHKRRWRASSLQVFTVPDVLPKRMSSRLTHICKVEQLEHDRHAVADLCQLADGIPRPPAAICSSALSPRSFFFGFLVSTIPIRR